MSRVWTEEDKKKFAADMKARREAKKGATPNPAVISLETPAEVRNDEVDALKRQIDEMKLNQDLMLKLLGNQNNVGAAPSTGINIGRSGAVLGEVEKYTVDPKSYESPVERLLQEQKLSLVAFHQNYELDYEVSVRSYENKSGVNMKEPEFKLVLTKIHRDGQGADTGKRYLIKSIIFHEDPQAAVVVARENGLDLGSYGDIDSNSAAQKLFLDEMRFLRCRDWLFDIFWPKGRDRSRVEQSEEVLDGTIVQTFSKPVGESGGIDFDKISNTRL